MHLGNKEVQVLFISQVCRTVHTKTSKKKNIKETQKERLEKNHGKQVS